MLRRCFLAVDLPPSVTTNIASAVEQLTVSLRAVPIRWVAPSQLHLTVHFFGSAVPAATVGYIRRSGRSLVSGLARFELTTDGWGTFPLNGGRPRIVYLTLREEAGSDCLRLIRDRCFHLARACQLTVDRRPWQPHITLGRIRPGRTRPAGYAEAPPPTRFTVSAVTLYQSTLTAHGPFHEPLDRFLLHGSAVSSTNGNEEDRAARHSD